MEKSEQATDMMAKISLCVDGWKPAARFLSLFILLKLYIIETIDNGTYPLRFSLLRHYGTKSFSQIHVSWTLIPTKSLFTIHLSQPQNKKTNKIKEHLCKVPTLNKNYLMDIVCWRVAVTIITSEWKGHVAWTIWCYKFICR